MPWLAENSKLPGVACHLLLPVPLAFVATVRKKTIKATKNVKNAKSNEKHLLMGIFKTLLQLQSLSDFATSTCNCEAYSL